MIDLRDGDMQLVVDPIRGGGVVRCNWRDHALLVTRPDDASPLGLGNFAMMPFVGRIAEGQMMADGHPVQLARNFPGADYPHAIHGIGWQTEWDVTACDDRSVHMQHGYDPAHATAGWPWAYAATQRLTVRGDGYDHRLDITNLGTTAMPTGLGLHPYFPRADASLALAVDGCWDVGDDDVPTRWRSLNGAPDWLAGDPVDTSFTGRRGPIIIDWPTHRLTLAVPDDLAFTHVYVPGGADYFCVEPVSQRPNAVNAADDAHSGLRWLAPEECWSVTVGFTATPRP